MGQDFQNQGGDGGSLDQTGARDGVGDGARAGVMRAAMAVAGELPTPQPRSVLCPFCGSVTPGSDRCGTCQARFDPLSRQATQNHMGPWYIRDERSPYRPGCTYETLVRLIESGQVTGETVIRGPSTRQMWTLARHTPGVSHRLGACHNCGEVVEKDAFQCPGCHAGFSVDRDRQHLGVGPIRPLPGQATPEALVLQAGPAPRSGITGVQEVTRGGSASGASVQDGDDPIAHARARVARYREQGERDRVRGVVALVLAGLVAVSSMVYAGIVHSRSPASDAGVTAGMQSAAVSELDADPRDGAGG